MIDDPVRPVPALRVRGVSKRFGGVSALDRVDLQLQGGKVTALLGENGAGKSTLIRICSGEMAADDGVVEVGGTTATFRTPLEAMRAGVVVVHQEPQLVDEMTVAENLFLHRLGERRVTASHSRSRAVADAELLLARLGMSDSLPDPRKRGRELSAAERQLVDIARALAHEPRVLFLDEPNSSLTRRETDRLFDIVRRLRDQGVAVVLVSHRLSEVYEIADEVAILRDGRSVAAGHVADLPVDRAIELMAGPRLARSATAAREASPAAVHGDEVLRLEGLTGGRFSDVSFSVRRGEIVGMAGLVGAGRTEIARAVAGADPITGGRVVKDGRPVKIRSPRQALRRGIAFIAEERRSEVFYGQTVRFNITASTMERFSSAGLLSKRRQDEFCRAQAQRLRLKAGSFDALASSLSGGNQQKLLLSRALASNPDVLILDEPTRGVDVGTKGEIYELLRELAREQGLAIWFISSELDELLELADRILVVRHGRIVDDRPNGAQAAEIVASAMGERLEATIHQPSTPGGDHGE